MNWLAHLLLSEPDPAFRIGNLLPDILAQGELAACEVEFHAGIRRHREIDSLTDSHPIVRLSIGRIAPPYRRFGGIITDILFDHFIAAAWSRYSVTPLPLFISEIHDSFGTFENRLPKTAFERLDAMRRGNWLSSYYDFEGLRVALDRTGARLRKPVQLGQVIPIIAPDYAAFRDDFEQFFPQLQARLSPLARL